MGAYVSQVTGSTSGVGGYLTSGWANLSSKADEAFQEAMNIASSWYSGNPLNLTVPTAPTITGSTISISTAGAPTAPSIAPLSVSYPLMPSLTGASYTPGVAPTFTSVVPSIVYPAVPNPTAPATPGVAPTVSTPTMPVDPTVALPLVPTLRAIDLPEAPEIILPTFAGASPSADVPELPNVDLLWSETAYAERLPALATKIATYLAFDYDAAETAIWERGQERIERSINTAVLDLTNDFASRGFALPTGAMTAAIMEARAKGVEIKSDNAKEAMIKAAELNTQKLALAIESGIKYESMWLNHHAEMMKRSFEAHRATVELTVKVYEMKVALFNARLQAYQVEAQVHRDLIQAELARLETYRTELEARKLIGELNMQDVELYKAQLQGALAAIDVYKAQVSAVVAVIEVDKAKLQAYSTEVDAYKARVEANAVEYSSWAEQMKGEAVKAQLYEAEVRAFAARVDAYKSQETVGIESAKLAIMHDENQLKGYTAQLAGVEAEVKAYGVEMDATSKLFDSQVKSYAAVMGAREAEARVNTSAQGLLIEAFKTEANVAIENARTQVMATEADIKAYVGRLQAAGSIMSQLAASAMSAFNLSTTASESFSLGVSNTLSESHSFTE